MQVFISWSGDLSKRLAAALHQWLPSTLQYVKPYFSPSDIEKGSKWDSEISKKLAESQICIIALTRESLDSKWIMFEAGAISSGMDKARVCAILFDLEPTDVEGPLERFQATKFSKTEIRQLLTTINANASERALSESVLTTVFDKWWPDLERVVQEILNTEPKKDSSNVRTDKALLEETLLHVRSIANQQNADQRALITQLRAIQYSLDAIASTATVVAGSLSVPGLLSTRNSNADQPSLRRSRGVLSVGASDLMSDNPSTKAEPVARTSADHVLGRLSPFDPPLQK